MSLTLTPALGAQLAREAHRERGSQSVEARKARRAPKRKASEREAMTIEGYALLSPRDVRIARRSIEAIASKYPGLDTALIESKALDALARSLVEYPITCSHEASAVVEASDSDSDDDIARKARIRRAIEASAAEFGIEASDCPRCASERPRRIAGRARHEATYIAGRAPTGRGRMPSVHLGERQASTPNYALWVGLGAAMRIDSRCWCHRGEQCEAHRVVVEVSRKAQLSSIERVELGARASSAMVEAHRVEAYAREVSMPQGIGKASKSMRWLASHYREPDSIALGVSIEARRGDALLDHSALANSALDDLALIAALGDCYAVRTKSGRYLWSRVDISSALARWSAFTGQHETRKTFKARLVRAIRTSSNGAQSHRASIEPIGEASSIEAQWSRLNIEAMPASIEAMRVELGARAYLALHRVEARHRGIEVSPRIEASARRWHTVEAITSLWERGLNIGALPAPIYGIEHRGDCGLDDACRCNVEASTLWMGDDGREYRTI